MRLSITILSLIVALLTLASCGEASTAKSPASPTAIATPTDEPIATDTPTDEPIPTDTPTATSSGEGAVLGATLDTFTAKYGNPENTAGQYFFQDKTLDILVQKDNNRVYSIAYTGDGNGWANVDQATTACRIFLPGDATFKRSVDTTNATQRVYLSSSVAPLFPAALFSDENGNDTDPGTIAIVYHLDATDNTKVVDCTVQVGLEQKV